MANPEHLEFAQQREIFDPQRLGKLIDAVFGVPVDEQGERASQRLVSDQELAATVNDVYSELFYTLSPREERVIKMRFGLGRDIHTQKSVAEHFNVSTTRIREIEAKALRKLRHPSRANLIKMYLDEAYRRIHEPNIIPAELTDVIEQIKKLTPQLIAHLQKHEEDLSKIHPRVFEHLIAEFFASWGFKDVRLVGANPRTSADIYAANVINPVGIEQRYFIEVKRWKHKVGIGVINQVIGAMISEREQFGWHASMIVTVAGFTDFEKWNREQLKLKGVELKDRDDLLMWLSNYKENKNGLWLPEPPTRI